VAYTATAVSARWISVLISGILKPLLAGGVSNPHEFGDGPTIACRRQVTLPGRDEDHVVVWIVTSHHLMDTLLFLSQPG
jgi:hypothetical protein